MYYLTFDVLPIPRVRLDGIDIPKEGGRGGQTYKSVGLVQGFPVLFCLDWLCLISLMDQRKL